MLKKEERLCQYFEHRCYLFSVNNMSSIIKLSLLLGRGNRFSYVMAGLLLADVHVIEHGCLAGSARSHEDVGGSEC
jgi:hypothetical protein